MSLGRNVTCPSITQIIDAYSSGSEAFKELQKHHGLKSEAIDDVMIDLEQVYTVTL